MAKDSAPHPDSLEALAIRRFGNRLSEAEKRLLRDAPQGEVVYCGPSRDDKDPGNDPANSDHWLSEREIRAELITWLCVNQEALKRIDLRGLAISAAKITGKLALSSATIPFPLYLFRCRLIDEADLTSIKVPQLCLDGSRTQSLLTENADIKANLLLQDVLVEGEVRLIAAQIGSTLNCGGSTFRNPNGKALDADRLRVEGGIFLRDGFSAEGVVTLSGARAGILSCRGGTFRNPDGFALVAENAKVEGNVFLNCRADGVVNLFGIQVGGTFNCVGGSFGKIILRTAVIKGVLVWLNTRSNDLDLMLASVGSITDNKESWPDRGHLILDGLVYERITDSVTDAPSRLDWLERQREFKPQPYRQLAKVLREMGDETGATDVLFEMGSRARAEGRRRLIMPKRLAQLTLDTIFEGSVGYGLHPLWALGWLGVLCGVGWTLFRRTGAMAPTDKDAYAEFRTKGHGPAYYQPFNPLIYSLENCVPVVKFGQDDLWQPDPNPQQQMLPPAPATGWRARLHYWAVVRLPKRAASPVALRWFRWIMIALGWVLATFFVAGLTGIIKTS